MKLLTTTILLLCASTCLSQTTPTPPKSPDVHPGRTVTFRVKAPKAQEVTLTGDWSTASLGKLTKDDQGIWSITVGPLEPGIAIYNFVIDGVAVADPVNPRMKLRAETSASLVIVPGDGSEAFAMRDVPHGQVRIQWQKSAALDGQTREFRVYTPPGYDDDANRATKYPVLYLLHGSNDTAAGWTDVGQANLILDNLIADKKAVPMIVVMPWGHAAPFRGRDNLALFSRYLLEDVVPTVEKSYRTLGGPEHRALVGLSMGGEQALTIGLTHLDLFATVGAFSAAIPRDPATTLKATLDAGAKNNERIKLLWIGCGKQEEGRFASNEQFVKLLTDHEIKTTFVGLDGLHNYTLWRKFLAQIAPLMFRES
jgi:enterochelin esterase-like enzyme